MGVWRGAGPGVTSGIDRMEIPLFPLRTVLFPGGPLPLRIFETRYIDMVGRCAGNDNAFGVVLIREGNESGRAKFHQTGTFARIVDWYQGSDGLLGITAVGQLRFRVQSSAVAPDGLNIARVEPLPPEPREPLPASFRTMGKILEAVLEDLGQHYASIDKDFGDASWVGFRFAEVLPIAAEEKQRLLEMRDPIARLELLHPVLEQLSTDNG